MLHLEEFLTDFGMGFYYGTNQSTTAAGQRVTKVCVRERLGARIVAQGLGEAARATKGLSGWWLGLSPVVWYQPVPGQHSSALSVLCARTESPLADVSPLVLISQG